MNLFKAVANFVSNVFKKITSGSDRKDDKDDSPPKTHAADKPVTTRKEDIGDSPDFSGGSADKKDRKGDKKGKRTGKPGALDNRIDDSVKGETKRPEWNSDQRDQDNGNRVVAAEGSNAGKAAVVAAPVELVEDSLDEFVFGNIPFDLMLDMLGNQNPIVHALEGMIQQEPQMLMLVTNTMSSRQAALRFMFPSVGFDEEEWVVEAAGILERWVNWYGDEHGGELDYMPVMFQEGIPTDFPPIVPVTPNAVEPLFPSSPQYAPLDVIPPNYTYRNVSGAEVALDERQTDALNTLRAFLDPNGQYQAAWWFADGVVTNDELLAVLIFTEGQTSDSVRQAVFARYLYYFGTGENNLIGNINFNDYELAAEKVYNLQIDRLVRFLSYFAPWREPDIRFTSFDAVTGGALSNVQAFSQNPESVIPGASTWTPTQLSYSDGVPGWGLSLQSYNSAGKLSTEFVDPATGQTRTAVDWANVPWHFVNIGDSGIPLGNLSARMREAIQTAIERNTVSTDPNQVYDAIQSGDQVAFILTPTQAVNFCNTDTDGFGFLMQECLE